MKNSTMASPGSIMPSGAKTRGITIERIEINAFGGLKEFLLEPKDGINMVVAPNESGKSTVAAFIKFIFYGFVGVRMQSISDNEKKKYIPWDLRHASGALVINTPRGRYRIERTFVLPNRDSVTIIDTATGKKVLSGVCPGEHFFGVGEEVFAKSVFFKQLSIPQNDDNKLAEQLRNLIFSADEQTSLTQAQKRLKEARNALVSRTNGKLPQLRRKYEELSSEFSKAESQNTQVFYATKQLNKVQADIAEKQAKLEKVLAEKKNLERYAAKLRLEEFEEQGKQVEKAKDEFEKAKEKFKDSKVPDKDFVDSLEQEASRLNSEQKSLEEKEHFVKETEETYRVLCEENPLAAAEYDSLALTERYSKAKTRPIIFAVLALLFGGLSAIAYQIHHLFVEYAKIVVYSLMGISGVFGVLFFVSLAMFLTLGKRLRTGGVKTTKSLITEYPTIEARIKELNKEITETRAKVEAKRKTVAELKKSIIEKLSTCIEGEIDEDSLSMEIKNLDALATEARTKQTLYEAKKAAYDAFSKNANFVKLTELAKDAKKPQRSEEEIEREKRFYDATLASLYDREKDCEGQLIAITARTKNPAELAGKRDSVKRKLDELEKKATAIDTAIELLEEASNYMRSMISPKLTRFASELFENASRGKYRTLQVDNNLSMTFASSLYTKPADFMSVGTRDAAYLCLRLSLAKLLYKDSVPPLVLDDAFGNLDDDRLKAMLQIIASYGQQVFIFSCLERERDALKDLKIEFSEPWKI